MTGAILAALVPIAILIALGAVFRRAGFLGEAFWPGAERLCYFVLLPAFLAHGLARVDLATVPVGALALVIFVSILAVAALLVLLAPRLGDPAAFTSIFQGGVRFNNYVGLSAVTVLYGTEALALAAVANAVIVPTVNVLCVLVFARFGNARPSTAGIARSIATNPLILGCLAGFLLQLSGRELPLAFAGALAALGTAALPLGLLCVGAALDIRDLPRSVRPAFVSSIAKFALMPAVTVAASLLFGLDGLAACVAVLFQALPTASTSYVMARQLGGDAPLMAAIIALQTVAAIATLPLAILAASVLFPLQSP